MKKFLKRGIEFVSKNPTIISSLILIFVVVSAIFLNSFFTLNKFQENLDTTLRTKAVLAENVLGIAADKYFSDIKNNAPELETKINAIRQQSSEVSEITIYVFSDEKKDFVPLISTEHNENNPTSSETDLVAQNARKFAGSVNDAFAYVSNFEGERFWNVVKALRLPDGNVAGILSMKFSLAKSDELVRETILRVYALSVGAVIVVLLLMLNHIRLFTFEIKAKKLEEIDKMKDDFISMASHELKSPLTAISGYTDLLVDTISCESEKAVALQQRKYLDNINISVDRLKTLVEDLLVVSRIEQNRLPVECVNMNATNIAGQIIDEMKVTSDQKGLLLKKSLSEVSNVLADPERVKQIMVNLLSNAIKYTEKGTVEIISKEDAEAVYITVADTGMGISAENMQQLFSKFYRVKNSQTMQISGTGLGLWIAREIAQKMGGNLTVESIEGVGSHFTLKLKKN